MSSLTLTDWNHVKYWCDNTTFNIPVSYMAEAVNPKYPRDAFSLGQLASKIWLLQKLYPIATHPIQDWAILGCWIGSIVPFLHKKFIINRVYGLDSDPQAIELSEQFNQNYVQDSWKFKGVVADVSMLCTSNMEFFTGGELIQIKPGVVINTSCEHMDTQWFESADPDQLIVMQTNNSPNFEGHINTCASIDEMKEKYPLSNALYRGEMKLPSYTRYMQIGYK